MGKKKKTYVLEKIEEKKRGVWGGFFSYASTSQYACRLEDVRLLWLAVPCVTAFKKHLPKEMSVLRALGCQMPGIIDRTAEEKTERCAQPASRTDMSAY